VGTYGASGQNRQSRKWLWGCCGGCAGLVVLILVTIGVGVYLLVRSRPVVPVETFLTAQADAFLIVRVSPEDEGPVQMLQELARRRARESELAEEQLITQRKQIRQGLAQALPLQVVALARHLEPGGQREEARFAVAGVFSIRAWSGLLRALLSGIRSGIVGDGGRVEVYQRTRIVISTTGTCLASVDNNFMFAQDLDTIKAWIDRIREHKQLVELAAAGAEPALPYEGPDALKRMLGRFERGAQLRFGSLNSHGEIEAFLEFLKKHADEDERTVAIADMLLDSEIASPRVIALGGMAQIIGPDALACELIAECEDEQFARGLSERLAAAAGQLAEEFGLQEVAATVDGNVARLTFQKTGLQDALREVAPPDADPQEAAPPAQ